jgi:hypothetical protein
MLGETGCSLAEQIKVSGTFRHSKSDMFKACQYQHFSGFEAWKCIGNLSLRYKSIQRGVTVQENGVRTLRRHAYISNLKQTNTI